jgi:hypothetical protein
VTTQITSENLAYRNFIHSLRSSFTKINYVRSLGYFMGYLKIDCNDYEKLLSPPDAKLIQSNIIDFLVYLRDKGGARERLVGHKLAGTDPSYDRRDETEILEQYLKAIDYLTINEENKLRRKVETLNERQDEIQKMKDKHEQEMKSMREEINQQFNQIMSMIQQNPKLSQVKLEALVKKEIVKSIDHTQKSSVIPQKFPNLLICHFQLLASVSPCLEGLRDRKELTYC